MYNFFNIKGTKNKIKNKILKYYIKYDYIIISINIIIRKKKIINLFNLAIKYRQKNFSRFIEKFAIFSIIHISAISQNDIYISVQSSSRETNITRAMKIDQDELKS